MNKSEEYLDSLLNNVSPERIAKAEQKRQKRVVDFGAEFESELNDTAIDDFIRDFEDEVDDMEASTSASQTQAVTAPVIEPESQNAQDSFFDNLEGIVNQAKESAAPPAMEEAPELPKSEPFEVNTLEDDSWTAPVTDLPDMQMPQMEEMPLMDDMPQMEKMPLMEDMPAMEEMPQPQPDLPPNEAQEILDLLEGLPSEEELSNISNMFAGEDSNFDLEETQQDSEEEDQQAPAKKVKEKKGGFLQKLLSLFSKKDKDALPEDGEAGAEGEDLGDMSDENMQILQELNDAEQAGKGAGSAKKKEKKKKKKKKKEEKAKEKKEKKEKAPKKPKEKKPKKEKEPKKPKEVDLSPPLKKAPVILIVVMAASVLILILLFTNLTGYSNKISEAKEAYAVQDYVGAYEKLSGLKTKEEDAEFYQQMMLLARVQGELLNGDSLYGLGQYTMSLDSYICALGRHDVNYTEATAYHVQGEYDFLAEQIQTQMSEKFGVSAETAREIYALDSRTEYTKRIRDIVKGLGLIE